MQIIDIKGKKWLVGLEWEILPSESSFKVEAKEVAEKTNCDFGILVDYDQQFAIGLSKKMSKVPSAATYLALANQEKRNNAPDNDFHLDWILVEDAGGDDKFWMSVIKNGIPSPQYDVILDITTVKDRITDLLLNDTFKLFSVCSEIKNIFDGMKLVEEETLDSLTVNIKTKLSLTKLRGIPNSVIYAGMLAVVAAFIIYGAATLIEGHNLKEKLANVEKQRKAEEVRKEKQYQDDLVKYNELKEEARKRAVQNVLLGMAATPASMLSSWFNTVGNIELGTHGWKLDVIECYITDKTLSEQEKSACDIKFIRNSLSTNRMFLQEYPNAIIKGNEALVTRQVPLDKNAIINMKEEDIKNLPTAKNWGFDMISQLQLLKVADIDHEVLPSTDITFTPPSKPVAPKLAANGAKPTNEGNISIGVAKGQIKLKSSNIDFINEVADNVDFSGVGARKATFKNQNLGSVAWEVTLDYFVRTDSTGGITGGGSTDSVVSSGTPNLTNK